MNTKSSNNRPLRRSAGAGFTLVELLTALALVAILAAILIPAINAVRHQALVNKSTATIRALGTASLLYANDHNGKWPRSTHSSAPGERNWWLALSAYLWPIEITSKYDPLYKEYQERILRDPLDKTESNQYSYGFNVHLQLNPVYDDYTGSPTTWWYLQNVPNPNRTVLFASSDLESSDHFMAHFWGSQEDAEHDLATRDGDRSAIVYCDGHVEWLSPSETYDPAKTIDHWNPLRASQQ